MIILIHKLNGNLVGFSCTMRSWVVERMGDPKVVSDIELGDVVDGFL